MAQIRTALEEYENLAGAQPGTVCGIIFFFAHKGMVTPHIYTDNDHVFAQLVRYLQKPQICVQLFSINQLLPPLKTKKVLFDSHLEPAEQYGGKQGEYIIFIAGSDPL